MLNGLKVMKALNSNSDRMNGAVLSTLYSTLCYPTDLLYILDTDLPYYNILYSTVRYTTILNYSTRV